MKTYIPITLIYSRLILGFLILLCSITGVDNYKTLAIIILSLGLCTDIFDGIIARQLNISTEKLRRLDSTVDQVFFILVATATYIQCKTFFKEHALQLIILLGTEALTYFVCYVKFRKEVATHSIGAKVWSLLIVATLIQIIATCNSNLLFSICFYIGIVTRLEIIAIIFILRKWTNDVPTFYHAIKLRNNKEIKRHKLFNG